MPTALKNREKCIFYSPDIVLPNQKKSIFGYFLFYFGQKIAFIKELPIKIEKNAYVCQIWKKSSHTMIFYVN